jgi:hypothetical protein
MMKGLIHLESCRTCKTLLDALRHLGIALSCRVNPRRKTPYRRRGARS